MRRRPPGLLLAATLQVIEAAGVCGATVLSGLDTADGRYYQLSSGVALTAIGFGTVVVLAVIAVGLGRVRRWSRTPALLAQLFIGIVGIYLLEAHRYGWGVPAVLLAVTEGACVLAPPSMRALVSGGRTASTANRSG